MTARVQLFLCVAQHSACDSLCAAVFVLHRTVRVTACVQLFLCVAQDSACDSLCAAVSLCVRVIYRLPQPPFNLQQSLSREFQHNLPFCVPPV